MTMLNVRSWETLTLSIYFGEGWWGRGKTTTTHCYVTGTLHLLVNFDSGIQRCGHRWVRFWVGGRVTAGLVLGTGCDMRRHPWLLNYLMVYPPHW